MRLDISRQRSESRGGFGEAGPAHGAPGQEGMLRWEQGWAACRAKDKLVSWPQGP